MTYVIRQARHGRSHVFGAALLRLAVLKGTGWWDWSVFRPMLRGVHFKNCAVVTARTARTASIE